LILLYRNLNLNYRTTNHFDTDTIVLTNKQYKCIILHLKHFHTGEGITVECLKHLVVNVWGSFHYYLERTALL
jgi:hypothetical protein